MDCLFKDPIFFLKEGDSFLLDKAKEKNFFIAELNGGVLHDKDSVLFAMHQIFQTPDYNIYNLNSLNDWLGDLSWLGNKAGYIVLIKKIDDFLKEDAVFKNKFLSFLSSFTSYWKEEVQHVVVGGETKEFYVCVSL